MKYASQTGYSQKPTSVARPHSADFLEFERRHPLNHNVGGNSGFPNNDSGGFRQHHNTTTPNRYARHRMQGGNMLSNPQPPRPKSSIEHRSPKIDLDNAGYYDDQHVNDVAMELANYDWSEESYADKMRRASVSASGGGNDFQSRSRSQSRASQHQNYVTSNNNADNLHLYHSNNSQAYRPNNTLQVNLSYVVKRMRIS